MKRRWALVIVMLLVAGGAVRAQDEVSWSNLVARLEELQKEMAALIAKAFGESGQTGGGTAHRFDLKAVLGMAHRSGCMANLRAIEMAKTIWAVENGVGPEKTPSPQDIDPYLPYGFSTLRCPAGGTYTINPVGQRPQCSVASHSLETGQATNEEELRRMGVLEGAAESGGMGARGRGR